MQSALPPCWRRRPASPMPHQSQEPPSHPERRLCRGPHRPRIRRSAPLRAPMLPVPPRSPRGVRRGPACHAVLARCGAMLWRARRAGIAGGTTSSVLCRNLEGESELHFLGFSILFILSFSHLFPSFFTVLFDLGSCNRTTPSFLHLVIACQLQMDA